MADRIRFIVIDDDPVNNFLCSAVIEVAAGGLDVQTFEVPEKGLEYIAKECLNNEYPTVLFLDINMPTWSGWDFLDNFEKLDEKIKRQIKIYILSSSIDANDKHRARENKNVVDYIEKPLAEKTVLSMLEQMGGLKKAS